ncbi:MAG: SLBB domain-containing protein [Desulfobulbaceae bacterium]|jgi:polysaccharide export outer membrane protein|nr:SLBB domain-containing protein [Desulfobulbaceae bacterium]
MFRKFLFFLILLAPSLALAAPPAYKLGARDIISVSIFAGGEEQIKVDLTVSDQGTVNFPFLGSTQAKGLTTAELEGKVTAPLETQYFVAPQVHIQVKDYQSLQFSISGAVKDPGNYSMTSATTIMDLIAKAGGVTREHGTVAYLRRNDEDRGGKPEPKKINLQKLLDEGDMTLNVRLESGDSVYIPLAEGLNTSESKVYVSGEVKKPAPVNYQPGLTALAACIEDGGFTQYAAPNRATLIRTENGEQKIIKIDLEKVTKGAIQDVPLKPGDRLNIPESWL